MSNTSRSERIRQNSSDRRAAAREETRQAILNAAIALFEERGYEGFSLRQVAESIGYTPTTIYLYFEDKDDLLFSVCQVGFMEFEARLRRAFQSTENAGQRLSAMAFEYVNFGLSLPLHYRVMFLEKAEWIQKSATSKKNSGGGENPAFGLLVQAIEAVQRMGWQKETDLLEAVNFVWASLHGIVSLSLSMRGTAPGWEGAASVKLTKKFLEVAGLSSLD